MRVTLKDHLINCLSALKRMTGQRDKWVTDWPGQVYFNYSSSFLLSVVVMKHIL